MTARYIQGYHDNKHRHFSCCSLSHSSAEAHLVQNCLINVCHFSRSRSSFLYVSSVYVRCTANEVAHMLARLSELATRCTGIASWGRPGSCTIWNCLNQWANLDLKQSRENTASPAGAGLPAGVRRVRARSADTFYYLFIFGAGTSR